MAAATSSQAWAILQRHARDEVGPLRLQELCLDNDRVSSLVAVHTYNENAASRIATMEENSGSDNNHTNSSSTRTNQNNIYNTKTTSATAPFLENRILLADLSRQRMTVDTLNHLLRLANACDVRGFIRTLAWGRNDRNDPLSVSMEEHEAGQKRSTFHLEDHSSHGIQQRYGRGNGNGAGGAYGQSASAFNQNYDSQSTFGGKQTRFAPSSSSNIVADSTTSNVTINDSSTTFTNSNTIINNSFINNNNAHNTSPSMHLALRTPTNANLTMLTSDDSGKIVNALDEIRDQWDRVRSLSDGLRRGLLRGAHNDVIDTVLVVGKGVPMHALEFLYAALRRDDVAGKGLTQHFAELAPKHGKIGASTIAGAAAAMGIHTSASSSNNSSSNSLLQNYNNNNNLNDPQSSHYHNHISQGGFSTASKFRRLRLLSSSRTQLLDPLSILDALSQLNPATTIVVALPLHGTPSLDGDVIAATKFVKRWLCHNLKSASHSHKNSSSSSPQASSRRTEWIYNRHFFTVTANEALYRSNSNNNSTHNDNSATTNTFFLPKHCHSEGLLSTSVATILPLSIVFGWDVARTILNGAHDLDCHFVETNPRHNLPVLLALVDLWNDAFLNQHNTTTHTVNAPAPENGTQGGGRVVTPFAEAFSCYPSFVAAVESRKLKN